MAAKVRAVCGWRNPFSDNGFNACAARVAEQEAGANKPQGTNNTNAPGGGGGLGTGAWIGIVGGGVLLLGGVIYLIARKKG